jgi:hypothetical protein
MRKTFICLNILFTVGILIAFSLLACERDCPSCPEPEPESVSDYDFYMLSNTNWYLYSYNTVQMALTDSFPLFPARDFEVSADGNQIIATKNNVYPDPDSLFVYNLPDMDTAATLDVGGYLEVSNNGQYIAVYDDSLVFLDGMTYQVLFTDSVEVREGVFLQDESKFYCLHDYSNIRVYDMAGESLYTTIEYINDTLGQPYITEIQPMNDIAKIFLLIRYYGYDAYLISYYPELDSAGFWYHLRGIGGGTLRLSPDGFKLVFTDPSDALGNIGTNHITFIDPYDERIITAVHPDLNITDDTYFEFWADDFTFSPDGIYAMFLDQFWKGYVFLDMNTHAINNAMMSPDYGFVMVSCRKFIK